MPARARTGVILAGGDGRRLGGDKPNATVAGRSLIRWALDVVTAAGLDPVVCAKPGFALADGGDPVRTLWEPSTPTHPLTGIAHALRVLDEPVVTMPCDVPFLDPRLLRALAAHDGDTAVIVADGVLQPLIGRYAPSDAEELYAAALAGVSVRTALEALRPSLIDADEVHPGAALTCTDVDTPEDLRRAENSARL